MRLAGLFLHELETRNRARRWNRSSVDSDEPADCWGLVRQDNGGIKAITAHTSIKVLQISRFATLAQSLILVMDPDR